MLEVTGLLLCAVAVFAAGPNKASTFFDLCKRSDPNISECIKNTIMKSKPKLIKGIPELDLVPLEPLHIPLLDMSQTDFRFSLKDVDITGLKTFNIEQVRYNDLKLNITMRTAQINFTGKYEMSGRIIVLPVSGKGDAKLQFTDVITKAISEMERYKNKGKTYIRIKSMIWEIEPEDAKSHFTNLLTRDKTIGDAINGMLNENWRQMYSTYRELPERAFGELFKEIGNRVLSHYTYDEWFPV